MNRARLIEELQRDEGIRLKPYLCAGPHAKIRAESKAVATPYFPNHKPDCKGVTAMADDHSDALEIWRPIGDFENYQVSSLGRVRQMGRTYSRKEPRWNCGKDQSITIKPKILNGWTRIHKGRPAVKFVALRKSGKTLTFRVHRLVLDAFAGPCPMGAEGCHNNGNALDNRIENLRWDTHKENIRDSIAHGTKTSPPVSLGESHHAVKVTDAQVAELRAAPYVPGLFTSYARKWGITATTVSRLYWRKSRA